MQEEDRSDTEDDGWKVGGAEKADWGIIRGKCETVDFQVKTTPCAASELVEIWFNFSADMGPNVENKDHLSRAGFVSSLLN